MSDLTARFSSLGPNEKAMILARVAQVATIAARERVTGYIMNVPERTEMAGQDQSVMAMIEYHCREGGLTSFLPKWLAVSN